MNEIKYLNCRDIIPSPDNARKTFARDRLERLKASILRYGVRRNLEVVWNEAHGKQQIVSGERRWRAVSELLDEGKLQPEAAILPAMILGGSDLARTKELNLIENLQRDDLLPDEEARGYAEMQKLTNPDTGKPFTMEEIAMEVSQEHSYIKRRLKLLNAPQVLLEAIHDGLPVSIGELAGRIPDPKERERFAKRVLHPGDQTIPLSYEQADELRRKEFMVSLASCGFSTTDPDLVPLVLDDKGQPDHGGPCADCPMRTGKMDSLGETLSKSASTAGKKGGRTAGVAANVCTLPACFRRKQDAHFKVVLEAAEQSGQKKLTQTEAKKVFSGREGGMAYDANYVDVEDKPTWGDISNKGTKAPDFPKWRKLVDEAPSKVEVVIAQHPVTGKVHYLVAKEDAKRVVVAKYQGATKSDADADDTDTGDAEKLAKAVTRAENKARAAAVLEGTMELLQALSVPHTRPMKMETLRRQARCLNNDATEFLCKVLQPDVKGKYTGELLMSLADQHLTRLEQLDGFLVLLMTASGLFYQGFGHAEKVMKVYCEAVEFNAAKWKEATEQRVKAAAKALKDGVKDKGKGPHGKKERIKAYVKGLGPEKEPETEHNHRFALEEALTGEQGVKDRSQEAAQLQGFFTLGVEPGDPDKTPNLRDLVTPDRDDDDFPALQMINRKRASNGQPPLTATEARKAYNDGIQAMAHAGKKPVLVGYYCDHCGEVCEVASGLCKTVDAMKGGEFLCIGCAGQSQLDVAGWPLANQEEYVEWKPYDDVDKDLKERIREYMLKHPALPVEDIADEFKLPVHEALTILDGLADDHEAAKQATKAAKKAAKKKAKK